MKKTLYYEKALKRAIEQKNYRQLRCVVPIDEAHILYQDRKYLNFTSNDFLGLSHHSYVKKNSIKFVLEWGAGSTASRLITGHLLCHKKLEEKLASLLGFEATLLFSSGFQANSSILQCLANPRSAIFLDRFCHNSLLQAAHMSRAKVLRFAHNDLAHLRRLLEKSEETASTKIIVSESVFHNEGDLAPLKELIAIAEEFDALLYIDDAHALGVFGKRGMGLCAHKKGIDIVVGTFGKACGSFGGYVACSDLLREYLINFCSGFIHTTALPPAVLGAIDAALDLIPDMESERKNLLKTCALLKSQLLHIGLPAGQSSTHVIPLVLGSSEETLSISEWLSKNGILTTAIRPPMVPPGNARIRLALNALHEPKHLTELIDCLRKWKRDPVGTNL